MAQEKRDISYKDLFCLADLGKLLVQLKIASRASTVNTYTEAN